MRLAYSNLRTPFSDTTFENYTKKQWANFNTGIARKKRTWLGLAIILIFLGGHPTTCFASHILYDASKNNIITNPKERKKTVECILTHTHTRWLSLNYLEVWGKSVHPTKMERNFCGGYQKSLFGKFGFFFLLSFQSKCILIFFGAPWIFCESQ